MIQRVSNYIGEVKVELAKVSWPTREELYGSTVVVIVLCLMLSIFVFGIDRLLTFLIQSIF